MRVVADILNCYFSSHHAIHPRRVNHDEWQENNGNDKHDAYRLVARSLIPQGQAAGGVGARWHDKREHGKASREDDARDGFTAAEKRHALILEFCRK